MISVAVQVSRVCRLAACLLAGLPLFDQALADAGPGWSVKRWGVAEGLPVNSVNAMVQDGQGYLWLATMDGLVRFDGVQFEVFDAGNAPNLPSNRLLVLELDGHGALWLATEDNRLVRFADDQFTALSIEHGLPDIHVHSLAVSGSEVWAGTLRGAARWNGAHFEALAADRWAEPTFAIAVDEAGGRTWLGANNGRVLGVGADPQLGDIALELPGRIWQLLAEDDGRLWIAHAAGLSLWQEGMVQARPIAACLAEHTGAALIVVQAGGADCLPDIEVFRVERAAGLLFLSSAGKILRLQDDTVHTLFPSGPRTGREPLALNGRNGKSLWFNAGRELRHGDDTVLRLGAVINDLLLDREGNLWIGSGGDGLYRLRAHALQVFPDAAALARAPVYPIVGGPDGRVWIGTGDAGLFVLEPHEALPQPVDSVGVRTVLSILPEADGSVRLGGTGLYRLKGERFEADGPAEIRSAMVRALHRDRAGRVWVGTDWEGLWWLHDSIWQRASLPPAAEDARVRAVAESAGGQLWFGTNGRGVLRQTATGFEVLGPEQGLPSRLVRALHFDNRKRLWLGTENRGLCRIANPDAALDALEIACLDRRHGLLHDGIHQILPDGMGFFWMSSNRGIFRARIDDLDAVLDGEAVDIRTTLLSEADGLPNREANGGVHSAGMVGSDGRLWFPTMSGPVVLDPARIQPLDDAPAAVMVALEYADQRLSAGPRLLRLPTGRRDVALRYTAPSFIDPEHLNFEYRLIGYRPDWQAAGPNRAVTIANLPHGSYRFEVRAISTGGTPGAVAGQDFRLPPRATETHVFRLGVVLLTLGLLALAWWWREKLNRADRVRLEALVAERTVALADERGAALKARDELARQAERLRTLDEEKRAFFANISHELRTPLTLLMGPLDQAEEDPQALVELAPLMQRNAHRLNRLVEQILDLQRIEADQLTVKSELHDLVAWTDSVLALFATLAEQRGIATGLRAPERGVLAWFDTEQMEKVLGNLLSNAIKYCRSGDRIEIRIERDGETARITIADTGPGIAPEHLPKLFDRFYRAVNPDSPIEGTGIGLALCRELVRLHGGDIRVDSQVGQGTRFQFGWPADACDGTIPVNEARTTRPKAQAAETAPESGANPDGALDSSERLRLLLVDDNADIRDWLGHRLAPRFLIDQAADGHKALACIDRALPDLIVSDWMMPTMNGIELLAALRERKDCDGVPVILLTARGAVADRIDAHRAGAVAYVAKPFHLDVLEGQIHSLLAQQQRLRRKLAAEAGERPVPQVMENESDWRRALGSAIDRHLHDPEFGVSQLARVLAMDRSNLYRRAREELGRTPSELLRARRMVRAGQLLEQKAGSISEIAYAVGFNSLEGFSRAYRAHFGRLPSEQRCATAPA